MPLQWPSDPTTSANTTLAVPVYANNSLFFTTLDTETRGTFDSLYVRDFLQNLQLLEGWTARFANSVSEDMKLLMPA